MSALPAVLGQSPGISAIRGQVQRLLEVQSAGRRLLHVLVLGETGTGKTLLAHAMHEASARAAGPFVSVNCAAIPETLLEAELFGFERGAFTDARSAKAGLFQTAHGGTLLLDEIGALPLAVQAKLLTALESKTIRRLGSTREEPVDVWIVAATSEDLQTAMRERRFREDLYHRLSTLALRMPPLRERPSDIVPLAEHFLSQCCADYALAPKRLAADGEAALLAHAWPGNVRELANLIERVVVLTDAPTISAADLALSLLPAPDAAPAESEEARAPASPGPPLRRSLEEFERSKLVAALESAQGNLSRAAAQLGMPRNTLRYRLAKYRLQDDRPPAPRSAPPPAGSAEGGASTTSAFLSVNLLPGAGASLSIREPLRLAMDKVLAFGGRVERLEADSLLAAFGPQPAPAAVSHALHTALAIQKAGDGPGAAIASRFETKAAIHVADSAEGATPAAVSLLDDLMQSTPGGAIVLSPAAKAVAEARFALREGPHASSLIMSAPSVSGKPSIAVLPFENRGADPGQNYFGEGITEDIIGGLSRVGWLFVIARHSTLRYRPGAVDPHQAARELGVRYLVGGSVRNVSSGLRVAAELTDAEADRTIWADHYDGDVADLYEFQDRITGSIVRALETRLRVAETRRAMQKRPENLSAYDCVLRAMSLLHRLNRDDFLEAGALLDRAIALEPDFSAAYTWRSWWYLFKIGQGWSVDHDGDTLEAERMADVALQLDRDDATALAVSGHCASILYRDYDKGLRRFERSLALNPNSPFTWGLSGATFCYLNQPAIAAERASYALRLSPFDLMTFYFCAVMGFAEMLAGRYEEAVVWGRRSRHESPRFSPNLRQLVACLAHLGHLDEARVVAREFLAIETQFTLREFQRRYPLSDPAALERYAADLRTAGLPD